MRKKTFTAIYKESTTALNVACGAPLMMTEIAANVHSPLFHNL